MRYVNIALFVFTSIVLSACATTDKLHFKQLDEMQSHAVLRFKMDSNGPINLFGVNVAKVVPQSINGLPVNRLEEDWKLQAYGEFLIPPGDTLVFVYCDDHDAYGYGNLRFSANAGETYYVGYTRNQDKLIFKVVDSQDRSVVVSPQINNLVSIYGGLKAEKASSLFEASALGNIGRVNALIKDSAEINWSGPRSMSALNIALLKGHKEIAKILVEHGAYLNMNTLASVTEIGDISLVMYFLEAGAPIDSDENSALMVASKRGYVDIVRYLLENKAYIYSRNSGDKTALDLAEEAGNSEIIDILKKSLSADNTMR